MAAGLKRNHAIGFYYIATSQHDEAAVELSYA